MMGKPLHHSTDYAPPNQGTANCLMDSLSVMIEQESSAYSCCDYLHDSGCASDDTKQSGYHYNKDQEEDSMVYKITPDDRMKLVDWCYQIIDQCKFDRETVALTMSITDRFMCTPRAQEILHHRGRYQLVALTALYMSIKLNERMSFSSEDFAALSHGTYSVEDIEDMERTMLEDLSWRMCPPTSLQVAQHILSLMLCRVQEKEKSLESGMWDFVHEEVAFQVENSIREYYFITQRPSTIATAAILNAIEQVDDIDYTVLILALISLLRELDFDSPRQIKEAMDKLHSIVDESAEEDGSESCVTNYDSKMSNAMSHINTV